jgi:4-amino-4-deoxy-L-arabinose transferase-like glycosyltransferase
MSAAAGPVDTLRRRDLIRALGLAVALFAVYAAGACRTIYVGDSGELVTAAYVLGVPHPTGYPLYALLGKLWMSLVPVASLAFRMSLFSAACAALACSLLFVLCRRLGTGVPAALTAALCLAFAPSFWGEANIQRVYALNALALAAALSAACAWWRRRDVRTFALTVFGAALGACNHTYMGVFLAAFGFFALLVDPAFVLRPRTLLLGVLAVAAGLLPYLYLPLAVRFDPPVRWGDPGSFAGFLDIVLRREFWSNAWVEAPADLLVVAADYASSIGRELTWAGALLALAGAVVAVGRRRAPALLIALAMLGNVAILALHGSRRDLFIWHRYYIPSYLLAALLIGLGADALGRGRRVLWRVLPLAIPLVLLVGGWRRFDRSGYRVAEDFARQVLAETPPGAVLAAADDSVLFPLLYLRFVERYREDVSVVVHGAVPVPAAASFDPEATPFVFTHSPGLSDPGLAVVPTGLTFRIWRADLPPPTFKAPPEELPGTADPSAERDFLTQSLIGQYHFMLGVTYENIDWPRAQRHLESAAAAAPRDDVLFYSLGLMYYRNGLFAESLAAFRHSVAINPRALSSAPEVRAADALGQIESERERIEAVEERLRGGAAPAVLDAAYHLRMAGLLAAAGEPLAARGHRLRAAMSGSRLG